MWHLKNKTKTDFYTPESNPILYIKYMPIKIKKLTSNNKKKKTDLQINRWLTEGRGVR